MRAEAGWGINEPMKPPLHATRPRLDSLQSLVTSRAAREPRGLPPWARRNVNMEASGLI